MTVMKRIGVMILAITMLVSVMAVTASAVTVSEVDWYWHFTDEENGFPELYNGSSENGYIKMLQRFLYVCPGTHATIYNASSSYHGIDGGFGNGTQAAVELFQRLVLGESAVDGYVGTNTWGAIYSFLSLIGSVFYYDGTPASGVGRCVIECRQVKSTVRLYTYTCNETTWGSYFRSISKVRG